MAEERIVEVETPLGNTHTSHTVVDRDRGGGAGWLIAIILILAVLIGGYFLMRNSDSEANKDNAVAAAANDVGDAAQDVANTVEDAADKATDGK